MVTQLIFSWNNPVSVSELSFQKQTVALLDRDDSKYCCSVLLPDSFPSGYSLFAYSDFAYYHFAYFRPKSGISPTLKILMHY